MEVRNELQLDDLEEQATLVCAVVWAPKMECTMMIPHGQQQAEQPDGALVLGENL